MKRRDVVAGLGSLAIHGVTMRPALAAPDDARRVTTLDRLREIRGSASGMMMLESGERSGMFIWEPSDMTAVIAADPQRGISVAPATSPAGADGAWLRKFDGALRPEWFGAIGDGIADDDAALRGMARVGRHFGALHAELTAGRIYTHRSTFFLSCIRRLHIEGNGAGLMNIAGKDKDTTFNVNNETLAFAAAFFTQGYGTYEGSRTPYNMGSLIRTVEAGSLVVDLAEPGIHLVSGARALIYGFDVQGSPGGFPPCPGVFEYVEVADVAGDVVTLKKPLRFGYDARWPDSPYKPVPNGRPRMLSLDRPDFTQIENLTVRNLHLQRNPAWTAPGGNAERNGRMTIAGFDTALIENVRLDGTFYVSQGDRAIVRNCQSAQTVESDKCLSSVLYDRCDFGKHILGNGTKAIEFRDCTIRDFFVANPIETLVIRGGRFRGESGGSRAMLGLYGGVQNIDIRGATFVCDGKPKEALFALISRSGKVTVADPGVLTMELAAYEVAQFCRAAYAGAWFYDARGFRAFRLTRLPYLDGNLVRMEGEMRTPVHSGDTLHLSFLQTAKLQDVRYVGPWADKVSTLGSLHPSTLAGLDIEAADRRPGWWSFSSATGEPENAAQYFYLGRRSKLQRLTIDIAIPAQRSATPLRLRLSSQDGPDLVDIDLSEPGRRIITTTAIEGTLGSDKLVVLPQAPLNLIKYRITGGSEASARQVRWSAELTADPSEAL